MPIDPIAAVNESVWEHLELGFWPALVYAALEYGRSGRSAGNFPPAKALGIYLITITATVLYCAYTAVLGHGVLAVDIAIFVAAVIFWQLVSHKLRMASALAKRLDRFAPIVLTVLAILFVVFTFCTPQLSLFRDSISGGYGIVG